MSARYILNSQSAANQRQQKEEEFDLDELDLHSNNNDANQQDVITQ